MPKSRSQKSLKQRIISKTNEFALKHGIDDDSLVEKFVDVVGGGSEGIDRTFKHIATIDFIEEPEGSPKSITAAERMVKQGGRIAKRRIKREKKESK